MDINELVSKFKRNYDYMKDIKNKYNEQSTRTEYIDPFFELLDWDIQNKLGKQPSLRNVIPESFSGETQRPDYTFLINGISIFFVEVKKPSVNIQNDMKSIFQARSYGWSKKHSILILTNFEYLLIYDVTIVPKSEDTPNTGLLKKYHFEEYIDKWDEIRELLSYQSVKNESIEKEFEGLIEQASAISIDEHFLDLINEWRIKIATDIYNQDSKITEEYLNEIVQRFINQMIFLRVCEDKNLPIYHTLSEIIKDKSNIKKSLISVIKVADKKYNAGVFDNKEVINNISTGKTSVRESCV